METIDILILTRSLERIVAALLGGGAIYMGFKVFISLPYISNMEDNFKFRKYLSFHLVKIGIGSVFAVFGAYIVLATVLSKVNYEDLANEGERFSGLSGHTAMGRNENELIDYSNQAAYFATLNRLPARVDASISSREKRNIEIALSRTKLNLMLAIWDEKKWGDQVDFHNWVIDGAAGPVPETVKLAAVEYFESSE